MQLHMPRRSVRRDINGGIVIACMVCDAKPKEVDDAAGADGTEIQKAHLNDLICPCVYDSGPAEDAKTPYACGRHRPDTTETMSTRAGPHARHSTGLSLVLPCAEA